MAVDAIPVSIVNRDAPARLLRAGLLTALLDGSFSGVLAAFFYGSSVTRLFQGVAATLLGPRALEGGASTALIGVLMHIGVAFAWSAVFLFVALRLGWVQRLVASPYGVLKAAVIYGPIVWMTMSLIVIPLFTHRPPAITVRWWIQFFGQMVFVGIPIVATTTRGYGRLGR